MKNDVTQMFEFLTRNMSTVKKHIEEKEDRGNSKSDKKSSKKNKKKSTATDWDDKDMETRTAMQTIKE